MGGEGRARICKPLDFKHKIQKKKGLDKRNTKRGYDEKDYGERKE